MSLVKFVPSQVGAFFDDLRINSKDDVKVRIRGGVLTAHVKRASGRIESATTMLGGQFKQFTAFDPSSLSAADRRKAVQLLRSQGHRQTAIGNLLGVSQPTISLDLKKLDANSRRAKRSRRGA